MHVSRKEIFLGIGVVLVAWVLLLVALSRWQASRPAKQVSVQPELLHYPGTEEVAEQESENLGWRKYWFTLDEPYPSTSVYQFYRREMEAQGWRLVPGGEPEWVREETDEGARDLFRATWLAPNRLYQLDLDMMSVVKGKREGEQVVSEERGFDSATRPADKSAQPRPTPSAVEGREPGIRVFVTLRRVVLPGLLLPPSEPEKPKGEIEVH